MTIDVILQAAGVIAALGVILGGLYATYRVARRVDTAIGVDKDGKTAIERLDSRVTDMAGKVERVEYQLFPNGGGSMSDRLTRVDRQVVDLTAKTEIVLTLLTTLVDNHGARTGATTTIDDPVAAPETKARLRTTRTSRTTRTRKE